MMEHMKSTGTQCGQSMIEYTVVIVFGILTITTGPMREVILEVMDTIRANYRGYTYTVSFAEIPEAASTSAVRDLLRAQGQSSSEVDVLAESPRGALLRLRNYNEPHRFIAERFEEAKDEAFSISLNPRDYLR